MIEIPSYRSHTLRKQREFAVVWAVLFLLLALGSVWRAHWHVSGRAYGYLSIAGALLLVAAAVPQILRPFLHVWLIFGSVMGHVVTTVVLTLLYVFVVTPMGWIARLTGPNLLDQRPAAPGGSYWIRKESPPPRHYRRLFVLGDRAPRARGGWPVVILRGAAAWTLMVIVGLCYAEVALRVYQKARDGRPLAQRPAGAPMAQPDPVLGWRPLENIRLAGLSTNKDGTQTPFQVSYDARGFRASGDLSSGRPRVLAVGDSFTWAEGVSDDKTWFATLGRAAEVEMFGYGAGGWGTLQEALALERHIGAVRPNLVVLQMTSNDFIENSIDLEWIARANNHTRRPYWVDDHVEYLRPIPFPILRDFAENYSRVAFFFLFRLDRARLNRRGLEDDIAEVGASHPGFARSVGITRNLLQRVQRSAGDVPVVAFMVGEEQPQYAAAAALCQETGILFFDGVPRAVDDAAKRGPSVQLVDAHWSEAGHVAAGLSLVPVVREKLQERR